jgi:hypothetical protein
MKKSNKILLSTAVAIFVAIPVFAGFSAITAQAAVKKIQSGAATKNIPMEKFQHVVVLGTWNVKIVAGNNYQVTLDSPTEALSQISVVQNADTVTISSDHVSNQKQLAVIVTSPQLTNVELHGTTRTDIAGFRLKDLSISMDGTHSLKGIDNQIENLKLHAAGTSSINLSDSKTTNAILEIFGTSNTQLNMQGGDLSGQAKGAVSITYSGTVKTQNIATAGIAKVTAR